MYNVGEMVFYGGHGVCEIEEITTMTVSKEEKQYYRLKSHAQPALSLFHPVVTDNPKITKMLSKDEAKKLLKVFEQDASEWIERSPDRSKKYKQIMQGKDHEEIAQMMNTILRKKKELEQIDKKLYAQDLELIRTVYSILTDEISIALNMSKEDVIAQIEQNMQ